MATALVSLFCRAAYRLAAASCRREGILYGNAELIVDCVQRTTGLHHTQPSLLHGDLGWPANCAASQNGPWIFDPACYWGDRECDLAMLSWFNDLLGNLRRL
ncbi:fructosamine kinase family protein [Pantoea ananatis]